MLSRVKPTAEDEVWWFTDCMPDEFGDPDGYPSGPVRIHHLPERGNPMVRYLDPDDNPYYDEPFIAGIEELHPTKSP